MIDIADICVERMTSVFGITLSAASIFIPIIYVTAAIVTEVYGYQWARRMIWVGIFSELLFSITLSLVNLLPTAAFHNSHVTAYHLILHPLFRNAVAYIAASLIGAFLTSYSVSNMKLLTKPREQESTKSFSLMYLRNLVAAALGEILFVVIGFSILFYNVFSLHRILELMLVSLAIKLFINVVSLVPVSFLVSKLKHIEHYDAYDENISFSPFKYAIQQAEGNKTN
jgi:uncharacterized integral membrane protein (TIGR00697 family)